MNSYNKNNSITQMPKEDDFLTKYGHYIGLFLSVVYIIGSLYYIIHEFKIIISDIKDNNKDRWFHLMPVIILLLGSGNIIYYALNYHNPDYKKVNNTVFHISMTPIYLILIIIYVMAMSNRPIYLI
jgi:hypothetical protein